MGIEKDKEKQANPEPVFQELEVTEIRDQNQIPAPEQDQSQIRAAAPVQEDPIELELTELTQRYNSVLEETQSALPQQEPPEELKIPAQFLAKYMSSSRERLTQLHTLYKESSQGLRQRLAQAREAENEKEVAELEAQLKEASDTLHELYRRHEENLILLRLPFLEEDETVREQLLAHYEDYFRSQLADFSQSSESAGLSLQDELVRVQTIQAILTQKGLGEMQEIATNKPEDMKAVELMLVVALSKKELKNVAEGQDIVTLPAFLQSEGNESAVSEDAIYRYKVARAAFGFLHTSQNLMATYEREYLEAVEVERPAREKYRQLKLRINELKADRRALEADDTVAEDDERFEEIDDEILELTEDANKAREEWYELGNKTNVKERILGYFPETQRGWIRLGDELSRRLNQSATRIFEKEQEQYDAEQDEEKKKKFREQSYLELSDVSVKIGNVGRMFTRVAFGDKLNKEQMAAYDRIYQRAMARFMQLADKLAPGEEDDIETLRQKTDELTRAAGETMQLLLSEKERILSDDDEPDLEEKVRQVAEERDKDKKEIKTDYDKAMKDAIREDSRREQEEERLRLETEKAELERQEQEARAALEEYERQLMEEARANSQTLRLRLSNRFAEGQEVVKPKQVLGKIESFTSANGVRVRGVGKLKIFGEKIFGLKASKLDERIGKHVDRFLASNGEITDGDLANAALEVVSATGLFSYAEKAPADSGMARFKALSEATDQEEIKRLCEQLAKDDMLGGDEGGELSLDDPFYEQYPNARKTVVLYRLSRTLEQQTVGKETKDLHDRLLAAEHNLKKLRDQVAGSPEYSRYQSEAVYLTQRSRLSGYRTQINQVDSRLAEVRSSLGQLPDLETYQAELEQRRSALQSREQAAFQSAVGIVDIDELYQRSLRGMSFAFQQVRDANLRKCMSDLAMARENDRLEREAYEQSLRRNSEVVEGSTEANLRELLMNELILHDAFTKKNRLFSFFRGKDDPVVGQLLLDNKDKLYTLVKKQMIVDRPGGIESIDQLADLPLAELQRYIVSLRERLVRMQAIYTKDRREWFNNPEFTESVLSKLLSGEDKEIGQLIQDVNNLHLQVIEQDAIMVRKDQIMLVGENWESQHVSVDIFAQKKARHKDATRSDSRLVRMMVADETVESLCRALGVEKPLSYYEVLARHIFVHSEDKALNLAGKQKIYMAYLADWQKKAEAKVQDTLPGMEIAAGDRNLELIQRVEQLQDSLRSWDRELERLRADHEQVKEELERAEADVPIIEEEQRDREVDMREAGKLVTQVETHLQAAMTKVERLSDPPENETEEKKALREAYLARARKDMEILTRRYEARKADEKHLTEYYEACVKVLEDTEKGVQEKTQRVAELQTTIADREKLRAQIILDLEQASMESRLSKKRLASKEKKPTPADVVAFLTADVKQETLPLRFEKSQMLEYGVYQHGARLLEGKLGKEIESTGRKDYNLALERDALHFFYCRELSRHAVSSHYSLDEGHIGKKGVIRNLDRFAVITESEQEYRQIMDYQLTSLDRNEDEVRLVAERKDRRLSTFLIGDNLPYYPLVPLLVKDEKCLRHILCDNDKDFMDFLNAVKKNAAPYMELLGSTGVYNGFLDQYLLEYGPEIIKVINGEEAVPSQSAVRQRFDKTYQAITEYQVTDTTLKDILDKAVAKVAKSVKKKNLKKEPGIPVVDPMTLCTMILITSGPVGLRDEERMEQYRERAEENTETLRSLLPGFIEREQIPEEEKASFLAGVELVEKNCLLQDPDVYARTVHERLHQYRSYEKMGYQAAQELTALQKRVDELMSSVEDQKKEGRKLLGELRERNAELRRILNEPGGEDPQPEPTEEMQERMQEIMSFKKLLPPHGGLTSFYQDMLARVAVHAVQQPRSKAKKFMQQDLNIMRNMLTMDVTISDYAAELRSSGRLYGKGEEELLRVGITEVFAKFATSPAEHYTKDVFLKLIRDYFSEEAGGQERLRIMLSDKGGYYGLGSTLSAAEKPKLFGQADCSVFEKALEKRKLFSPSVRLYFTMQAEERAMVAQLIANEGVPLRESKTTAQQLYQSSLRQMRMRADDDEAASSYLVGLMDSYLTGLNRIAEPDYSTVMAVLQRTVGMRMDVFEKAVRTVQNLQALKDRHLLMSRESMALLLAQ